MESVETMMKILKPITRRGKVVLVAGTVAAATATQAFGQAVDTDVSNVVSSTSAAVPLMKAVVVGIIVFTMGLAAIKTLFGKR